MSHDDPDACSGLAAVHRRYAAWILARARRTLGREGDDAAQEVWLRFAPAFARLRSRGEPAVRATLGRTLRSVCVDAVRRRARRIAPAPPGAATEIRAAPADDAEESRELAALVRARWQRLPARQREVVKLRLEDGVSFREIAEILGVPQGSVAGWYSRAIAALREGLP